MRNLVCGAKWFKCASAILVFATVLCVAADHVEAGAAAASALNVGKARAAGVLSGPENGQQSETDIDPFGPIGLTAKRAEVSLEDSNRVLSAEAEVRSEFDFEVKADSVSSLPGPDQVWGNAGPEDPFVAPIVPIPGIDGVAALTVSGGGIDMDGITLSGSGDYNENGYLELGVLDVGPASLEVVADILEQAGSIEKAEADGLLPDGVGILAKWRETDLSSELGPFTFTEEVSLPGAADIQDRIMFHSVAHAVGVPEPSAVTLALLALIFGFPRALRSQRKTSGA